MPQLEQTPIKLYRYSIGTQLQTNSYTLAEFWTLYLNTFKPSWATDGTVAYGRSTPDDVTVTLHSPWGSIQIYPLPASIGKTRVATIQAAIAEDKRQCSQCDAWFSLDEIQAIALDGDTVLCCEACKDDLHTCERCSEHTAETHTVRNGSRRRDEEEWCGDCKDIHAQRCDDCRDWFSNDCDGLSDGADWYCESCSENYSTCESCGTLLSQDEQRYDEDSGNTYCERHAPSDDDDEDSDFIHDYGYKPRTVFHGCSKLVHYGVELEVSCNTDTAEDTISALGGDSHVYLKADSTIEGGGYEIVTHPHTLVEHRKLWAGFNEYARRKGFKANDNGMHVHIERAKLTPYRIALIQMFLNRDDNRSFVAAIAQRDTQRWAACKAELAKGQYYGDGRRYSALNLCNSKTIEVRIFRGTIRKPEFLKNLEFCDALVHWSIDRSHTDTGAADFISYVRNNRKVYPALDAFLVLKAYLPAMPVKKEMPVCA